MTLIAPLRFGLIGVDSPHAPSFTRLFGNGFDGVVPGGVVTHAWKGEPASDFPLSRDRIDDFAEEVSGLGVVMCDSPEAVAEACDALLIVSSDARTHPRYFQRVVRFGKPIYVDTRFAPTLAEARTMLAQAQASGALVLAGSPKRFTPEFQAALTGGPCQSVSLDGPLPTQPGHPGLAWYGVHLVDLAVAALGAGPEALTVDAGRPGSDGDATTVTVRWGDGRVVAMKGEADWSPFTTGRIESDGGCAEFSIEAGPPMLVGLLEGIVKSIRSGTPNVPLREILSIVAIVEAANRSLEAGLPVPLPPN
ncbi:gfo/Idh/MocA family oxidoreductase [Arthrobacter sp. AK01]|uniref:Gfo/Idh/MocA family protein n=1 Tax=Micrococcaceae TaxID=1268 RepID=UPI001E43399B|nr:MULTISPECIES: gfo/Idh/MocA family oxidoreductase [Micrococcaceae]MCD4849447.1 gfo/Idh/MocA family oxidoreductase [Arthrobacter sp. AK01]MCP1410946.1 putative dehydrogenase [Paenarthrobacter sp. A20]